MKFFLLAVIFLCFSIDSFSQASYREEFNGPFNSWANVKTRFKAAGNGIQDDTKALQAALDSLSTMNRVLFNDKSNTRYMVVYLPAGTYKISQTLKLAGKIGISFIGEDPLKTIIKWAGGDNDTMLFSNRCSFMKISRITWDAGNKKNIEEIGLHYKDFAEPNFAPTSIEFSDMIFTGNPAYGISAGTYSSDGTGMMDAEVAIKRCKFNSCQTAGIAIKGFNALDYWIWDSEFNNCNIGVDCSHGNYHLYQSHFNNSQVTDINIKDATYSSVRQCYSNNSKAFSIDVGASCNAFKRVFQGNLVKGCKSTPIQYHHQGKITLLDNYFLNADNVAFTVDNDSWCNGHYDILSLGNSYGEANPNNFRKDFPSVVHSIADVKVARRSTATPAIQPLQPFVPLVKRKIFEVPAESDADAIQKIIYAAAALKGQRPVVHFPMGNYNINKTIIIPAGSDMQLIGDGLVFSTVFRNAAPDNPKFIFFKINGPSYITIRDFEIGKDAPRDNTIAFSFSTVDQPASQARIDQIFSKATNSLFIDQLNNTYFEKNNSFLSKGNTIIGGSKVKNGTGTSKLYCFGGQSAAVHLENNATMVARDCWWEGAFKKDYLPLDLTGNGNLTVDGAMYAPTDSDSGTIIRISDFKGKISLLNMYLLGSIDVKPNSPQLKMLVWNVNNFYKKSPFLFLNQKMDSKIAMMGFTTQCISTSTVKCAIEYPLPVADASINITDQNNFIDDLMKDDRNAKPRPYINLAGGVSNIYISRVSVQNGAIACLFSK
jgi:hypothetical protein